MSDLQVEEHPRFHKREWAIQRASWVALFAFLCAGALGFFGHGKLSHATASGRALTVQYERYERHGAQFSIHIAWSQKPGASGARRISLERKFLDDLDLQNIVPDAEHVVTAGDRITFEFNVDSTAAQHGVTLEVLPVRLGRQTTWIVLDNADSVRISQFVYP